MKLPRLGNPTTHRTTTKNIFGEIETTEVTTASQFDLMPTWAQWTLIIACVTPFVAMLVLIYLT